MYIIAKHMFGKTAYLTSRHEWSQCKEDAEKYPTVHAALYITRIMGGEVEEY